MFVSAIKLGKAKASPWPRLTKRSEALVKRQDVEVGRYSLTATIFGRIKASFKVLRVGIVPRGRVLYIKVTPTRVVRKERLAIVTLLV
jgi:hypothetical protein